MLTPITKPTILLAKAIKTIINLPYPYYIHQAKYRFVTGYK
jgi:hypothetical protein